MTVLSTRAVAGVLIAALIAATARRTRSLSSSGAVAATVAGALAVAVDWSWGVLLVVYFVASTVLSHVGSRAKESRTMSVVAKGGARDAAQVLANGGLFAAAALGMLLQPNVRWFLLGAGSLAASAADTWATELGTLYGNTPRSLLTWQQVEPGTSGGVTVIGSVAAMGGAAFVALIAALLGWSTFAVVDVAIGGVAGAFVDSILGATVQACSWCDACGRRTERIVHHCGTPTRHVRGLRWLDNDMVNFLSNLAGGLLAAYLAR
jgi:uncharacterized protein (TIGR00297 family)